MKIVQLVHTLSYGDAISGEVLAIDRLLKEQNISSEIFAINEHPKLRGLSTDYRKLSKDFSGLVILHYSLGSPLNDLYRNLTSAKRYLIHHNLTPADWFKNVNPRISADIMQGQKELPELAKISDRLLADSKFNADELNNLGFNAQVLELPLDSKKWEVSANAGIKNLLASDSRFHLLSVGRLAPNKKVEDIIKTFYFYHHKINPKSKLWLVGIDIDTEIYSFALKRLVQELKLDLAVEFTGPLSDEELKALYEEADLYLCASEHEGFCVPVVEAMYFGLPVVAYESSALPQTLKNAGVLISDKSSALWAELIEQIRIDQVLRTRLIDAGKNRVAELSLEKFAENFKQIINNVCSNCA